MLRSHRLLALVFLLALIIVLPPCAEGQLAEFEEAVSKLEKKLPPDVWDGKAL